VTIVADKNAWKHNQLAYIVRSESGQYNRLLITLRGGFKMKKHLIAFRDFRSTVTASPSSDGLDAALVSANEWLARTGIQPLNVETIVETRGRMETVSTDRGIRVWYEIE
jgi:hypothetical protein